MHLNFFGLRIVKAKANDLSFYHIFVPTFDREFAVWLLNFFLSMNTYLVKAKANDLRFYHMFVPTFER